MSRLAELIGRSVGATLEPAAAERIQGGSISECYRWRSDLGPLFVKLAPSHELSRFETEAAGLAELSQARAVRVPRVLGLDSHDTQAWLVLEWIQPRAQAAAADAALGEQLANLHHITNSRFGWHRSNTLGRTLQLNEWSGDWLTFYRERRLRPQLALAAAGGHGDRLQVLGAELIARVPEFFGAYRPVASLLHGDLWNGNRFADERGQPVIVDPAVYYGDREADLAMTRLFGGFSSSFYAAYEASWPLDPGAAARTDLYNVYHVLNHLNMFGGCYRSQTVSMMESLLAQVR